ncbi:MAG: D-glycerate dehydrogenase [Gemmatimonadetes bacterium]|nr:D-glycerate dehydrogenase [Gemmatimonadota bacterium]
MSSNRVLITRQIPEAGLAPLRAFGADLTVLQTREDAGVTHEELVAGVRGCDVLLPLLTEPVDRTALTANDRLMGVAQMAVGFNNIDVEAATELGIPVSNTPGVLTDTTADCTWALLLATARRVVEAHRYMAAGKYNLWGPNLFLGEDVGPGGSGEPKVLGIIGYGRIGEAVAKRALGFDMIVLAYDPYGRDRVLRSDYATWAELDELLERSDFVTLHNALTDETRHMIGEPELERMKPTAHLINAARGPVIDEKALVRALREGWIAGAGLDVYEDEPVMAEGLADCPNAVLLPHIASASRDTRGLMASMAATNAIAHLRKERAPNAVNPEVYDTDAYRARVETS